MPKVNKKISKKHWYFIHSKYKEFLVQVEWFTQFNFVIQLRKVFFIYTLCFEEVFGQNIKSLRSSCTIINDLFGIFYLWQRWFLSAFTSFPKIRNLEWSTHCYWRSNRIGAKKLCWKNITGANLFLCGSLFWWGVCPQKFSYLGRSYSGRVVHALNLSTFFVSVFVL